MSIPLKRGIKYLIGGQQSIKLDTLFLNLENYLNISEQGQSICESVLIPL